MAIIRRKRTGVERWTSIQKKKLAMMRPKKMTDKEWARVERFVLFMAGQKDYERARKRKRKTRTWKAKPPKKK